MSFHQRVKNNLSNPAVLKELFHEFANGDGHSMIAMATNLGCTVEVLRFLINEGCGSIDARYDGRTALYLAIHLAVYYRRDGLVELLLEAGANHYKKSGQFKTPPIILAAQRDVSLLQVLLRHDPHQIDWTDCNGVTALRSASKYGNLETARFLIKRGADPTLGDHLEKKTPLCICRSNAYFPESITHNHSVLTILQNRQQIAKLLEEEDRGYHLYKGYIIQHARLVAKHDYPRDLFSILHLPEVLKQRVCRHHMPRIWYVTQGLRTHPQEKVKTWNDTTQTQEVLHEVWGMKLDMFRELLGFLI
jgi:hypothetical protein